MRNLSRAATAESRGEIRLGHHDDCDQITTTMRGPRLLKAGHASTAQVFRKDETYGSNFVQEVRAGSYPVIAEAIGIQHRSGMTR